MRKFAMGIGIAGALVLASAGTAAAGEYTGNGKVAPGGDRGRSECSYSGRDAPAEVEGIIPFDDDPYGADFHGVQSYGQFVAYSKTVGELGLPFPLPTPGEACRGDGGG